MAFFKALRSWFTPARPSVTPGFGKASPSVSTDVYFHEDSYCQIELLPSLLADYCRAENRRIQEFAEAHSDGGIGYTGIYMRPEPSATYQDLLVALPAFSSAASSRLPPCGPVFTGYSTYREPATDTHAWGKDTSRLFADTAPNGVVAAAWLVFADPASDDIAAVHEALLALPRHADTLLVDWTWHQVVLLSDPESLLHYLLQHSTGEGAPDGGHDGA